jgi:GT2 family glycosyltransferase
MQIFEHKASGKADVAIIIPTADHASQRAIQAVEAALAEGADVYLVESFGPEFNYGRSVNAGIRQALSNPDIDWVITLNDDCEMESGWVAAMTQDAKKHGASVVGATLHDPAPPGKRRGRVSHKGGRVTTSLTRYLLQATFRHRPYPLFALRYVRSAPERRVLMSYDTTFLPPHFVLGACMLVSRQAYEDIGPINESFAWGWDDVDYGLRALEKGLRVYVSDRAHGVHEGAVTAKATGFFDRGLEGYRVFLQQWPRERFDRAMRR